MYDDIHLHVAWSYILLPLQFHLFDTNPHSVQPSSLRPSSLPPRLYFHFNRPPSYVVLTFSHPVPILLHSPFLAFLFAISPTFFNRVKEPNNDIRPDCNSCNSILQMERMSLLTRELVCGMSLKYSCQFRFETHSHCFDLVCNFLHSVFISCATEKTLSYT